MDIYSTYYMLAAVKELPPEHTFFKRRYFPTNETMDVFGTTKVLADYAEGSQRRAPFVLPRIGSVSIAREGYSEQVNLVAGSWGVVTALNFIGMGWTAKGNYTACYPASTDIKDQFIPISRMFDWVGNTFVRTFWARLDRPMTRRLVDNIMDICNIWLNGQVAAGRLLGARAVMLESENSLLDLMAGIIRIHVYITPPSPAQEIDFTLEYDISYMQAALAA